VIDGPGNNERVLLDATLFTPEGTGRVPAIVLAHGFGETKDAVTGEAIGLARAGFAVLAEVGMTCTHVVVMHLGRRIAAGPVAEIIGGGGSLRIGTARPTEAARVLGGIDGVVSVAAHAEGVLVHPGDVGASDLVVALVQAGVPVERVAPSRRLEDAFLALIAPAEQAGEGGPGAPSGPSGPSGPDAGQADVEPAEAVR